jgi:hypothetical protein
MSSSPHNSSSNNAGMSSYQRVPTADPDNSAVSSISNPSDLSSSESIDNDLTLGSTSIDPIKFTIIRQGCPNQNYLVDPNWTIAQFKSHAFPTEIVDGKMIILIYLGKVLLDNQTIRAAHIQQNNVIHAHISSQHNSQNNAIENNSNLSENKTNGLVLIDFEGSNGHNDSLNPIEVSPSQREIYNDYIREMESRRSMELTEGNTRDLLIGFFFGSVLGILAMYFVWQSHTSRKLKLGVMVGVLLNVIWSLTRAGEGEQKRELGHRIEHDDPDPLNPPLPGIPTP